ncbi:MAG: hypothetical protein ACLR8U_03715 [Oscillospiraceae bacterium]
MALLLGFGFLGVQLTAFCFGLAAVGLTCLMGKGGSRASMILSGIMMGSLFSALVSLSNSRRTRSRSSRPSPTGSWEA